MEETMRSVSKHEMIVIYDNNHNCSFWSYYWRCVGHTCCCIVAVAVPLCEAESASSQPVVGGKFKKGRERSVLCKRLLFYYLCYDKCHRHSHTKKKVLRRSKIMTSLC